MWVRNGNIFRYEMHFLLYKSDVTKNLLYHIQLFSLNIANPIQYFIDRFGMKDEKVTTHYNENFIRFLLTFFNNYPYEKKNEKLNMKEYVISLLYSKDYSFGQIVSKVQKYFNIEDGIKVNRILDEIIKELKCILTPRQLFESSYFTLNPNIVYDYDIFSIYSYINSKINYEKIKFTPFVNTEFNKVFEPLQVVYKSPFYYNFLFNLLEKYSDGNSIILNEYLLWMIIRSLIFYPNELISIIKSKYIHLIEIFCNEFNKNDKNELIKYILESLSKKDETLNQIIKEHSNEKINMKKSNKDLIAKKMALIKRKQAAFTSTLPAEYNLTPTPTTPSADSASEVELCAICKEEEKKEDAFVYFFLSHVSPIYDDLDCIPIINYCGHYVHLSCYNLNFSNQAHINTRNNSSPFKVNGADRTSIDFWYNFLYI